MSKSSGVLINWSEGIKVSGVVGQDVAALLQNAISKIPELKIEICALVSNTTGTLLSYAWRMRMCQASLVLAGKGSSLSYVEDTENIPHYNGDTSKTKMVVDMELGNFGSKGKIDFVRTAWDIELDKDTDEPGKQICDKMILATYFGEVIRRVISTAVKKNIMLKGKITPKMATRDTFTIEHVVDIAKDRSGRAANVVLQQLGYHAFSYQDCVDLEYVCNTVCSRAWHLVAAYIAAVVNYLHPKQIAVSIDGYYIHSFPGLIQEIHNKVYDLKFHIIQAAMTAS